MEEDIPVQATESEAVNGFSFYPLTVDNETCGTAVSQPSLQKVRSPIAAKLRSTVKIGTMWSF